MNHRPKYKKFLGLFQKNIGVNPCNLALRWGFIDMTSQAQSTKKKPLDLIKIKSFVFPKTSSKKWRDNPQNCRTLLEITQYDKGLLSVIYKDFLEKINRKITQLKMGKKNGQKIKRKITQLKNGQKFCIDTSPKKIYI